MEYLSVFIISFAIALSGAMAPGPLMAAVISGSLKNGFKTGPLIISGHALLEILMVAVLVLGLGRFIDTPGVLRIISAAGAVILIYFGISMLLSVPRASLYSQSSRTGKSSCLFLQGITLSVANPYWTIWWLTIGLGLLLSAGKKGFAGLAFFFTGHILADLLWYSFISLGMSRGKKFITESLYRKILKTCALAIIIFGAYFAVSVF